MSQNSTSSTTPPKGWFDWITRYKPTQSGIASEWSGLLHPHDHPRVKEASKSEPGKIWTLLDIDGKPVVTSGLARANRIGCFLTEVEYCGKLCDFFVRETDILIEHESDSD